MRVLVCGGRDFGKQYKEKCFISDYLELRVKEGDHIIQGGATGVDSCARSFAITNYLSYSEYPAQWLSYGKAAGFIRNKQMLVEGKPDLVIAFPGGKGTAMMVKLAKEANVEVIEVTYEG